MDNFRVYLQVGSMRNLSIILIILILATCKASNGQKEEKKSLIESLSIFFLNANRISISGQAVKGIIKNGNVDITPLNAQGTCDRANVLTTADTDDSGNYTLKYNKTGKIVCVIVSGSTSVASTMYDEKTQAEVPVPPSFELVNLVSETSVIESKKKNSTISLFSKMIMGRLRNLHESNTANVESNTLLRKASKEVVVRFGLNTGIGSLSGKSNLFKNADRLHREPELVKLHSQTPLLLQS